MLKNDNKPLSLVPWACVVGNLWLSSTGMEFSVLTPKFKKKITTQTPSDKIYSK